MMQTNRVHFPFGGTDIPVCDEATYSSTHVYRANDIGRELPRPITDRNVGATIAMLLLVWVCFAQASSAQTREAAPTTSADATPEFVTPHSETPPAGESRPVVDDDPY